jgi:hypothetical protein
MQSFVSTCINTKVKFPLCLVEVYLGICGPNLGNVSCTVVAIFTLLRLYMRRSAPGRERSVRGWVPPKAVLDAVERRGNQTVMPQLPKP